MKALILLAGLSLFTPLLHSCSNSPVDEGKVNDIQLDLKSQQLVEADNALGLELFSQVNAELKEDENLMISPLSISLALAMVYNGAEEDTKAQMERVLHKTGFSAEQINQAYKLLVDALGSHDPKVELSIANAIFHRDDFNVKSDFISTNQSYYAAEVEALDFKNPDAALSRVNGWVKDQTRNKIEKIIEEVSSNDVMYLINAIYFNGQWTYRFDKDKTADRVFYTEKGNELQVPSMMLEKTSLNYTETEQFQLLELPYGSEKYSMLIFLPHENYSTHDVIGDLNQAKLNNWLENLHQRNLKVYLPKLEFAYESSLVDNLKALGMNDAFDASRSNFSGISNRSDLFLSEVKHKSFIKLDEKGTEAAAVTGVTVAVTSIGPEPVFDVNRPFVFAIREKDTNAFLFMGKVNNPLRHE
ncbi:serpin family protein [Sunxiuqinia sp. sy24]|uniref:serpin family protein n=1 Tax=Sunxiuqinia sp. sy24 TaxID=3461495 RepID=UPI004045F004